MTSHELRARLVGWIDARLDEILAAPRMWGAALEAVEMQVLTLLEVRALVVDLERELREPRRILDAYVRILGERFPGGPPRPAHQLVAEDDDDAFVALVRDLSAALCDPLVAAEDDFFARAFLGIELRFAAGQGVSTQAVTTYYEDFRRATRSLARVGGGKTGRVERAVEMATDFVLEALQITPLNGVPAGARLALGAPYGQLEIRGGTVQAALRQILDVAARAEAEGTAELFAFGDELDPEARTRALLQTLRVLPRGAIDEVTIGGTYVEREPVRLRKIHAPKLMAAVAERTTPSLYDQTALIRAIDLDRGSIFHGNTPRSRVLVYVRSELAESLTEVGVRARIVGHRYEPRSGHAFVIAEEIDLRADPVMGREAALGGPGSG